MSPELVFWREGLRQELAGQRLDDVIADPGILQISKEGDFIAVADRNHSSAGLADIGEDLNLGQG